MNLQKLIYATILILTPIVGFPAIVHVPGDYLTIQAAVDAAADGDTVLIADGIYTGPGNYGIHWDATNKHLVIKSENGREYCIIDCEQEDRAFFLNMGQDNRDVIEGITITNGWVYGSGGAICINITSPMILNCRLVNNTSYSPQSDLYYGGGALAVYNTAAPIIKGNIIRNNSSSLSGGAIRYNQFASGVLEDNIIEGNFSGEKGGGAISLEHFSNPKIINNLIVYNVSDSRYDGGFGGGIATSHSGAEIINNTIAFNSTGNKSYPGKGGGIAATAWEPFPVVRNCIIWYNASGSSSMNIEFDSHSWMDISYCNVEEDLGHIFDLKPHTNMDLPPEFADTANSDFQLTRDSPCINRGGPDTSGLNLPLLDLAGNLRIIEDTVDIGAYEFNLPSDIGIPDLSRDFYVYPNPSDGSFFLGYRGIIECSRLLLRICDLKGRIICEEFPELHQFPFLLNISGQARGVYILTVFKGGKELYRQKLIKK